ncbi:MAG: GCN5-related N-acetyltransferase [Devosia sp.]|nr:GCN5-related N-acetyltransferase [Devosia sp.]
MAVSIRLAQAEDVPAIADLIDAAYQHYVPIIGGKPRPMLDDHAARTARGENFVCKDDDALLAVIALTQEQPAALHIFNIAVHLDAQGRGLLRQLLAFAEAKARDGGLPLLTLYTNQLMTRNRAIYARLGFAEVGTEEANGYKIVFMQRPVAIA